MTSQSVYEQILGNKLSLAEDSNASGILGAEPPSFCTKFLEDPDSSTDVIRLIFTVLFLVSVLGLLVIAGTIFYSKKLQSHP